MIIASIRSFLRIYRGLRPHPKDLDKIIEILKKRFKGDRSERSQYLGTLFQGIDPGKMSVRLRKFQLKKLRRTVDYVYNYVPYYKEHFDSLGVKPGDIQSLADIQKIPITYRKTLEEQLEDFISNKQGLNAVQLFKTSGTTGKQIKIYLSEGEFHYYAASEAIAGLISGMLGPTTIYQLHLPLDISAAATISTRAAQMAGALVLNLGLSGTVEENVKSLFEKRDIPGKDNLVSVLFAQPTYLWTLTKKAEELGLNFNESGLKRILTGGAMVTEDLKNRIRRTWGIQPSDGYAMVEAPAVAAGECPEGNMHFIDLTGYIEVLDPVTQKPVAENEAGVLVITEFYPDKEMMPLLRYWTNDLVLAGSDKICPCGSPTTYIKDILGRADQMVIIGAMNYYPQEIGDSLLGIPGLSSPPRFKVSVTEEIQGQKVFVEVESIRQFSSSEKKELQENISKNITFVNNPYLKNETIEMLVEIVPPGSIKDPIKYKHIGPDLS
jgi:phenylacetate-CoA ligase